MNIPFSANNMKLKIINGNKLAVKKTVYFQDNNTNEISC